MKKQYQSKKFVHWYKKKVTRYPIWIITGLVAWYANPFFSLTYYYIITSNDLLFSNLKFLMLPIIGTIVYFVLSEIYIHILDTREYKLLLIIARIIVLIFSFAYGFSINIV